MTQQGQWEKRVGQFNRSRAMVSQAIHDKPGMTYVEIRIWIREHFRFEMENVGARCRELYNLRYARKEVDATGRVHVYPMTEVSF